MFQVSTLQALALGYSRAVITVGELMKHGDIGREMSAKRTAGSVCRSHL